MYQRADVQTFTHTYATTGTSFQQKFLTWKLADLANQGLAAVGNADRFRLLGIQVKIVPLFNTSVSSTVPFPDMYAYFDGNGTPATTFLELMSKNNWVKWRGNRTKSLFVRPVPLVDVDGAGSIGGVMNIGRRAWLETSGGRNVPFYGMGICSFSAFPQPATATVNYTVYEKYYFQVRELK